MKNMNNKYSMLLFGSARIINIKLTDYFYSATLLIGDTVTIEARFMYDLELIGRVLKPNEEIHYDGFISGDRKTGNFLVVTGWRLLSDYEGRVRTAVEKKEGEAK